MKKIILSLLFVVIGYTTALAQYDSIPVGKIPDKMQEIKNGTLKDSVFWSCVGLFDALEYKFVSVYDYKIYVSNQGLYFELSFKDKAGNISVSGVYFMPYFRKSIPIEPPPDYVMVPNEHFCRCTATVGFAMVQKTSSGFTCVGARPEYDVLDNLDISCQDAEAKQVFFKKYYEKGLAYKPKLKIKEPEILLYSAE